MALESIETWLTGSGDVSSLSLFTSSFFWFDIPHFLETLHLTLVLAYSGVSVSIGFINSVFDLINRFFFKSNNFSS